MREFVKNFKYQNNDRIIKHARQTVIIKEMQKKEGRSYFYARQKHFWIDRSRRS